YARRAMASGSTWLAVLTDPVSEELVTAAPILREWVAALDRRTDPPADKVSVLLMRFEVIWLILTRMNVTNQSISQQNFGSRLLEIFSDSRQSCAECLPRNRLCACRKGAFRFPV